MGWGFTAHRQFNSHLELMMMMMSAHAMETVFGGENEASSWDSNPQPLAREANTLTTGPPGP